MKKKYIKLNRFAVHQKLTQHCKSAILQLKKERKEETNKIYGGSIFQYTGGRYWLLEDTGYFSVCLHVSILVSTRGRW